MDLEEDKNCLVVCHGALIRLLLCRILSMPIDAMWRLSLDNTASCKVVYTQEFGYRVITTIWGCFRLFMGIFLI